MTRIFDDPATFTEDMLAGFVDANQRYVAPVPGGVVRATETPTGKVAVVVGGGSGHYPAFCGLVGPGFADGAVVGNVFTSPSAADAVSVGRAADGGAGVVFSTGNYAGDVMNFNQAVARLAEEGIDARYVLVTDDIASAPPNERTKRRGIAGDFTVFKVASAAAEAGYDLDGVQRVAERANDRTRSLGVAFDGCTLPGADKPLFTVDEGKMGLGLGIHGEPGIADYPLPSAAELAKILVDGVLADAPEDAGTRVCVILNGLGRTKYEELFVAWRTVSRLVREAGLDVVEPEVGELVTSLDMAGCSLTVMWLDDELEKLWSAPADSPAYRKGALISSDAGQRRTGADTAAVASGLPQGPADEGARAAAATIVAALEAMAGAVADAEEELGRIDAVAGDGDHGRGMVRGTGAAVEAAREVSAAGAGPATTLTAAGDAWAARAGGTSGVLWGAALAAVGRALGDAGRPDARRVAEGVRAGYEALVQLGGAKPGDKTMLDAWLPFSDALTTAVGHGESLVDAWSVAVGEAQSAAQATAALRPKVGRARPLAERSLGTPDAGAVSLGMCVAAVARVLSERDGGGEAAPDEGSGS
ncbi:MAG: dihydroxyacetone kinase [Marmoricola sp.]|nr:dihydroxyacetone kinase [Marmoricola sp.]